MEKKEPDSMKVALVGGACAILAALIGLGGPIIDHLLNQSHDAPPVTAQVYITPSPAPTEIAMGVATLSPFPAINLLPTDTPMVDLFGTTDTPVPIAPVQVAETPTVEPAVAIPTDTADTYFPPTDTTAPDAPLDLTGDWAGTLVQTLGPSFSLNYDYSLSLTEDSNADVTGDSTGELTAYKYWADTTVKGYVEDGTLYINDDTLQDSYPAQGEWNTWCCNAAGQSEYTQWYWCPKTLTLDYYSDTDTLEGTWTSDGCSNGTVILHKQK